MNDTICPKCGNGKYPDASQCDACYKQGSAYDESNKDPYRCQCGGTKETMDSSCCRKCWNKGKLYDDGRG